MSIWIYKVVMLMVMINAICVKKNLVIQLFVKSLMLKLVIQNSSFVMFNCFCTNHINLAVNALINYMDHKMIISISDIVTIMKLFMNYLISNVVNVMWNLNILITILYTTYRKQKIKTIKLYCQIVCTSLM